MEERFATERGVLLLFQEKGMGKERGSIPGRQVNRLRTCLKSRICIFNFVLLLFLGQLFQIMFTVSKMQEYDFSLTYIFQYSSTIYAIVVHLLLGKVAHI